MASSQDSVRIVSPPRHAHGHANEDDAVTPRLVKVKPEIDLDNLFHVGGISLYADEHPLETTIHDICTTLKPFAEYRPAPPEGSGGMVLGGATQGTELLFWLFKRPVKRFVIVGEIIGIMAKEEMTEYIIDDMSGSIIVQHENIKQKVRDKMWAKEGRESSWSWSKDKKRDQKGKGKAKAEDAQEEGRGFIESFSASMQEIIWAERAQTVAALPKTSTADASRRRQEQNLSSCKVEKDVDDEPGDPDMEGWYYDKAGLLCFEEDITCVPPDAYNDFDLYAKPRIGSNMPVDDVRIPEDYRMASLDEILSKLAPEGKKKRKSKKGAKETEAALPEDVTFIPPEQRGAVAAINPALPRGVRVFKDLVPVYDVFAEEIKVTDYVRVEGFVGLDWGQRTVVALRGKKGIQILKDRNAIANHVCTCYERSQPGGAYHEPFRFEDLPTETRHPPVSKALAGAANSVARKAARQAGEDFGSDASDTEIGPLRGFGDASAGMQLDEAHLRAFLANSEGIALYKDQDAAEEKTPKASKVITVHSSPDSTPPPPQEVVRVVKRRKTTTTLQLRHRLKNPSKLRDSELRTDVCRMYILEWLRNNCAGQDEVERFARTGRRQGTGEPPAFTIDYLQRVPRLRLLVSRLVAKAIATKKQQTGKKNSEPASTKMVRVFQHVVRALWREGHIVHASEESCAHLAYPFDGKNMPVASIMSSAWGGTTAMSSAWGGTSADIFSTHAGEMEDDEDASMGELPPPSSGAASNLMYLGGTPLPSQVRSEDDDDFSDAIHADRSGEIFQFVTPELVSLELKQRYALCRNSKDDILQQDAGTLTAKLRAGDDRWRNLREDAVAAALGLL